MLVELGYAARAVHDAPAALEAALTFRPDVAVVDIGLPVMNGYELARRFRTEPALRRIRLVALTGYGQEQDRQQSAAAGFSAHLVKPVDVEELKAALETTGAASGVTVLDGRWAVAELRTGRRR